MIRKTNNESNESGQETPKITRWNIQRGIAIAAVNELFQWHPEYRGNALRDKDAEHAFVFCHLGHEIMVSARTHFQWAEATLDVYVNGDIRKNDAWMCVWLEREKGPYITWYGRAYLRRWCGKARQSPKFGEIFARHPIEPDGYNVRKG